MKIQKFTDLKAWQEGHQLVLLIYQITRRLPAEEKYGLTSQMRRAAVSITSNLAEGFSKKSFREKIQFYNTAKASLTELENQLTITRDVSYVMAAELEPVLKQLVLTHKIINGLIRKSNSFNTDFPKFQSHVPHSKFSNF